MKKTSVDIMGFPMTLSVTEPVECVLYNTEHNVYTALFTNGVSFYSFNVVGAPCSAESTEPTEADFVEALMFAAQSSMRNKDFNDFLLNEWGENNPRGKEEAIRVYLESLAAEKFLKSCGMTASDIEDYFQED